MAERTEKRVVAVDRIHRPGKEVEYRNGQKGKRPEVIEPGTILRGLPKKEVEELIARGSARVQSVVVEVADAPKGKGSGGGSGAKGGEPTGGGKQAEDGAKGGEPDEGGEKK